MEIAVFSREQAATYIGVSANNLGMMAKKGIIKKIQVSTRRIGFAKIDLDAYIESKRVEMAA